VTTVGLGAFWLQGVERWHASVERQLLGGKWR